MCEVLVGFFALTRNMRAPTLPTFLSLWWGDIQTERQTDRQTGWPWHCNRYILKYWTMRCSKFVSHAATGSRRLTKNKHTHPGVSPALYCTVRVCVLGNTVRDWGVSGWGRRLILSRWCNQTGRVMSQRAALFMGPSRLVILSVANGHLIQSRVIDSLKLLHVGPTSSTGPVELLLTLNTPHNHIQFNIFVLLIRKAEIGRRKREVKVLCLEKDVENT